MMHGHPNGEPMDWPPEYLQALMREVIDANRLEDAARRGDFPPLWFLWPEVQACHARRKGEVLFIQGEPPTWTQRHVDTVAAAADLYLRRLAAESEARNGE